MQVKEIENRQVWDKFLKSSRDDTFFQTWEWGEFHREGLGVNVWRLGFYEESELVALALVTQEQTKFGPYVYCPRGPVVDWSNNRIRGYVLKELSQFFEKKGQVFLRIDPAVLVSNEVVRTDLRRIGFDPAVRAVQVERAWMLDLKGHTEDELMAGMRKNSRYYLKKAIKQGVTVRVSDSIEDMKLFIKMLHEMGERKKVVFMPEHYLMKEYEYMVKSGIMKVLVAEYKRKPVATALIAFYGTEGSYLHAASSDENGNLQAPYLIQWEAIKYALKMGLEKYNFWGVVEDAKYKPGLPGFGYSNFKRGFGGRLELYLRAQDLAYDAVKYGLVRLVENVRSKLAKSL